MASKKCRKKQTYIPNRIRSHPFKCISLPVFGICVFIVYWLILCPLLYVMFFKTGIPMEPEWIYLFWGILYLTFILLMVLLVTVWRCNPSDESEISDSKTVFYTISSCHSEYETFNGTDSSKTIDGDQNLFQTCSTRRKPTDIENFDVSTTRPVSQNLETALTPRELFFYELIESANKSCCSVTDTFLEKERLHSSENFSPVNFTRLVEFTEKPSSTEYFIANVTERKSCTTEAYLFIETREVGDTSIDRTFRIPSTDNHVSIN